MAVTTSAASPLPLGEGRRDLVIARTVIEVHSYQPASYRAGPLLMSFHGLSRDMGRYLQAAKPIAERHGMVVVMPLFDRACFPYWRYQALLITRQSRRITIGPIPVEPRESWTSALIMQLIDEIRRAEGNPRLEYYLMGHSAGGQIANRMTAFAPDAAKRIVVANPSSFVQPSRVARRQGWKFNWRLVETPRVGHDIEAMYNNPQADLALFGTSQ